jgi:uncharacterized protein with PIN domain
MATASPTLSAKVSGQPLLFNGDDFTHTDIGVVLAGR